MRKLDLYWMSNREWREYKDHIRTIKDSAPLEAKASYERYLEQVGVAGVVPGLEAELTRTRRLGFGVNGYAGIFHIDNFGGLC